MGMIFLGIWLVLYGISSLVPLAIPGFSQLLAVLAIVAGLLILVGR